MTDTATETIPFDAWRLRLLREIHAAVARTTGPAFDLPSEDPRWSEISAAFGEVLQSLEAVYTSRRFGFVEEFEGATDRLLQLFADAAGQGRDFAREREHAIATWPQFDDLRRRGER